MSLRLMSAAWAANLPSTPKLVLLALADNANDEGNCAPSMKRIAQKCSLTERAVLNNINLLEKSGFLLRQNRQFKSNVYTIAPPNTWQTERAKPSKQRQKQAEKREEQRRLMYANTEPDSVHTEPDSCTELNSVRTEPNSVTNITIKSTTSLRTGDARAMQQNAWVRDATAATVAVEATEQTTLPDWVDKEAFSDFKNFRKNKLKKPLSGRSEKIALTKLLELVNAGEIQRDVIDASIFGHWAGLYPVKNKQSGGFKNKPEKFNAFNYLVEKNRGAGNERDITNECE